MEFSPSDKDRIEKQFDHFCKKTITNEMRDIKRHYGYLKENEKLFSELSQVERNQLFSVDKYSSTGFEIAAAGFLFDIENELLYEAINTLPRKKRNVILLSYWFDMTDAAISRCLNLVRRTVSYMRTSSLKQLKKYIEDKSEKEPFT
ncbi:MAG: sigma-70 family RNA polymerase sigma factor [Bacillota bacterium]